MANNFVLPFLAPAFTYLESAGAAPDQIPTTLRDAAAFDAGSSESIIINGVVPEEYTGSGTLKTDIYGCGNTTTAADGSRFDVVTEFRTPDAGEALSVANFDGTPDSGTMNYSTTAYDGEKITITLTPAVTPVAGDLFRIKITRDHDHADDDMASDCFVPEVVFYEAA